MIKNGELDYDSLRKMEPKKFQDLEYTMRLIYNHEDSNLTSI